MRRVVDEIAANMGRAMHSMSVEDLRSAYARSRREPTSAMHSVSDHRVPSMHGEIPVRVYRPTEDADLPAIMWLHSGGCVMGGLDQNEEYLRRLSLAVRAVVVSVEYRLAPEHRHPAALEDCGMVWDWLISAPEEVVADVSGAAIAGESAGGTLAFALCQLLRDEGRRLPHAQMVFYGSAEMRVSNPEESSPLSPPEDCEWFWNHYVPDHRDRLSPYVSPGLAPDLTGLPPTLVVTAEVDPVRDATEEYARRMTAAGVPVSLERYSGVMHGFATMLDRLPEAVQLFDKTARFLGRYLRAPGAEPVESGARVVYESRG
jgi:acetyl esterase